MSAPNLDISADPAALADRVAGWLTGRIAAAPGRFALNLSGGSTPRALYALLAGPTYRDRIDWGKLHLFWGDERFVPFDDKDSNYRMVRETLLDVAPIPKAQIHPMPAEAPSPEAAARAYDATLRGFYGTATLDAARPLFDVTLLGLGPDGHTASLFPGTAALTEEAAWVTAVVGAKPEPRLTMTYPVLAASRTIAFLVAGPDKQAILRRVLGGDTQLPATRLAQAATEVIWFLDGGSAP
jgi:6-phosphogluconolactonase